MEPRRSPGVNLEAAIAFATGLATLVTFAIAIFTPPISGPFCVDGCVNYPFTDIASRFPRDYLWMYPALLSTLLYVSLLASLLQRTSKDKRLFGYLGLSFALMASTTLFVNYFIQLTVIQPSLVNGEGGLSLLTQYNPHGLFIAAEEAGYLLMSVSFLCLSPMFAGGGLSRVLRWMFVLSFVLVSGAFISMSITYGVAREYRFEVVAITIDWLVLIVASILIGLLFVDTHQPDPYVSRDAEARTNNQTH